MLMRYFYDDPRIQDLLQQWAKLSQLIIVSCFFWNAGSTMQKTLNGLLHSLLHALLINCPILIQASSPWRWQSYELGVCSLPPWCRKELLDMFQRYVVASEGSTRICVFIDGLDDALAAILDPRRSPCLQVEVTIVSDKRFTTRCMGGRVAPCSQPTREITKAVQ